ncbi:MAG: M23 family metallopeptidase [Lachnospiraceae bacterium]|nr:M23 family metallopeptidase [Lachnospiraceae bacterium]
MHGKRRGQGRCKVQGNRVKKWKLVIAAEAVLCLTAFAGILCDREEENGKRTQRIEAEQEAAESESRVQEAISDGYIKWVDFNVSYEALCLAYEWDVNTWGEEVHIDWVEMLAYLGARYGGDFSSNDKNLAKDVAKLAEQLIEEGVTMEELTKDMQYYAYYKEAYGAVLGGMVGEYEIEEADENGNKVWKRVYGLKAFSPIARGFEYTHYADFGSNRSYGYQRPHLGHDMMGQIGTPIIAVESGYVEAIGWNQYGGWRIGIRSFDGRRYYYYAHMRQNYPYAEGIAEGSIVTAGDVIGYMGHTGYSATENVNNIEVIHLHWGMQLIFDDSQKDGNNQIWIDVYPLTQFLYKHRSEVEKVEDTREWRRVYDMKDPAAEAYREAHPE